VLLLVLIAPAELPAITPLAEAAVPPVVAVGTCICVVNTISVVLLIQSSSCKSDSSNNAQSGAQLAQLC
jgi:hypothetical protein